jgi:hypothetical protein
MTKSYPFPLPYYALADYCHPSAEHLFGQPVRHGREILCGNGYLALRCHKGQWFDDDFAAPAADFLRRFEALPWGRLVNYAQEAKWRALDEVRGYVFRRGPVEPWLNGRCAPSPVWRVAGYTVARLSHLQRIAALPRAELYCGLLSPQCPVFFRFSGGVGILAHDKRLSVSSGSLFAPHADPLTGQLSPAVRQPKPSFALPGWPPPEAQD